MLSKDCNSPAEMQGDRVNRLQSGLQLLRHPLLLLLATALISGYLVPYFTSGWQNHQKDVELKTDLIGEMSRSVSEVMLATQFATVGARSQSQEDFDRMYRTWEIERTVIGAKILGYFGDTALVADWDRLGAQVTRFYATAGISDPTRRLAALRSIAASSPSPGTDLQPAAAGQGQGNDGGDSLTDAWLAAREGIMVDLGSLTQHVLHSRASMFR